MATLFGMLIHKANVPPLPIPISIELPNRDIDQIRLLIEGFFNYRKSTEILLLSVDNSEDDVLSNIGL